MKLKRIYHHYTEWEDYQSGFYADYNSFELQKSIERVTYVFSCENVTRKYMTQVTEKWIKSCEHNLTNYNMNRIAWLGQAACCLHSNIPSKATMNVWKMLDRYTQDRSDKIAIEIIEIWEQKQKYKNTLISGNKKDTSQEYQMKLLLN